LYYSKLNELRPTIQYNFGLLWIGKRWNKDINKHGGKTVGTVDKLFGEHEESDKQSIIQCKYMRWVN